MTWLYVPSNLMPETSSDCLSAPVSEGSISGCISQSPAIALCVTSSGKPSLRQLSWPGWKIRPWLRLLSGTISNPSMADAGVDAWTSSLRVIRVSRSRRQASGSAKKTSVICGHTSGASSSSAGPSGSFLKTSAGISRSASMLSIESYRALVLRLRRDYRARQKQARAMSASDCSSWPTTRASNGSGPDQSNRQGGPTLQSAAALWPTPSAALTNDTEGPQTFKARQAKLAEKGINGNGAGMPLTVAVKDWPTPTSRDWRAPNSQDSQDRRNTDSERGQQLPNFVEHCLAEMWGTPRASDADKGGPNQAFGAGGTPLPSQVVSWKTPRTARGGVHQRFGNGLRAAVDRRAGRGFQRPIYPPGPSERSRWGEILDRWSFLAPAIPRIRRVVDGMAAELDDPASWLDGARADRLRATGNGVVPLAAAAAYRALRIELELRADARIRA